MKNLCLPEIERYRDAASAKRLYGWPGDGGNGVFRIPSPSDGQTLVAIASDGDGWDHVSVSRSNRPPNWAEMEKIKRLFFKDDEVAMQLHVPPSEHINVQRNCLHLWRPQEQAIPRPPGWMVAPKEKTDAGTPG